MLRGSHQNLHGDATLLKSLTDVKNDLKREIEACRLKSELSSPDSGVQMRAKIEPLELELAKMKLLTVAPSVHLPRGMIARISLRFLGGPAAQHASDVMCRYPRCYQVLSLAALKSEHAPSG